MPRTVKLGTLAPFVQYAVLSIVHFGLCPEWRWDLEAG